MTKAPLLGLLRPGEVMSEERLQDRMLDLKRLLPITLRVSSIDVVYSPLHGGGVGCVLAASFPPEDLEPFRNILRPFRHEAFLRGSFHPHMVITPTLPEAKTVRRFVGSLKTYLHGMEVTFDEVDLQYGQQYHPGHLYCEHIEGMADARL
jgi:hypothetical protein